MGDDGFGAAVAHELRLAGIKDAEGPASETLPGADGVRLVQRANAELGLIPYFVTGDRVIVIDAMDAGAEPGASFRFSPDEGGVTQLRSHNIHGMGVSFLLTNARLAGHSPDVTVFAVQVAAISPNPDTLSTPVAAAVRDVARMVLAECAAVEAAQRITN